MCKDISISKVLVAIASGRAGPLNLCNFGRGHYEKLFCEIILYFNQWFRRRCRLKYFFSTALATLFSPKAKQLCNLIRWYYGEHFFEIIVNLDQYLGGGIV